MLTGTIRRHIILFIIVLLAMTKNVLANNEIESIRVWPAPENTRIVFDLKEQPDYSYFTLSSPNRLVIDFKDSTNKTNLAKLVTNDKRVTRFRTSKPKDKNGTRLVLELSQDFQLTVFPLPPAGQYGERLVVDLYDKERPTHAVSMPKNNSRDIIIGIDAGHGGEDPGSIGNKGTYEKHVTLAIAKKLQTLIDQEKGMKAVMIRTGDYYVNLDRRTEIARKNQVDFLVSIHADAFHTSQPHGSSVWVILNRRVESEMAKWLVNREKNSELLGGGGGTIKATKDDNLAFTLADMSKEHSLEVSLSVADHLLNQLRKVNKLHNKAPQHGNFAVLKASDIPSVLVETGFISNHQEEQNLKSPKHQLQLANSVFTGLKNYFLDNPPMGTYFASISYRKHKVSSGESLSVLAQRYNVSVNSLKSTNNLTSNNLKIGQTLKIPRAD